MKNIILKQWNAILTLSLISAIPISVIVATNMDEYIPMIASIIAMFIYDLDRIKVLIHDNYKIITNNILITIIIYGLIFTPMLVNSNCITGVLYEILWGIEFILFIIYIIILQDIGYKCDELKRKKLI